MANIDDGYIKDLTANLYPKNRLKILSEFVNNNVLCQARLQIYHAPKRVDIPCLGNVPSLPELG